MKKIVIIIAVVFAISSAYVTLRIQSIPQRHPVNTIDFVPSNTVSNAPMIPVTTFGTEKPIHSEVVATQVLTALPLPGGYSNASILDLVNKERTTNGLSALAPNINLALVASLKTSDMVKQSYFSHTNPEGTDFTYNFFLADYARCDTCLVGENLAVTPGKAGETPWTPVQLVAAWMNSPEHRANILQPKYNQTGFDFKWGTLNGLKVLFVAEEFGQSKLGGTTDPSLLIARCQIQSRKEVDNELNIAIQTIEPQFQDLFNDTEAKRIEAIKMKSYCILNPNLQGLQGASPSQQQSVIGSCENQYQISVDYYSSREQQIQETWNQAKEAARNSGELKYNSLYLTCLNQ